MLSAIREKATGWIAWIIVILISIPFALWGVNSYFEGATQIVIAVANGVEIEQSDDLESESNQRSVEQMKEWVGNPRENIVNTGLLYIKNKEIKDIYVKRCFDLQKYIIDNYDDRFKYHATCAQYLLSEIIDYYDLKCLDFKNQSNSNAYYHLVGSDKFKDLDFTRYNLKERTVI